MEVAADTAGVWRAVEGIGGETGCYSFPVAWAFCGWMDRLVGGIGLRRAAATGRVCAWGTLWTSGAWRPSTAVGCCGCARR